jgi:cytochrome c oxidase assembly factor CtaG
MAIHLSAGIPIAHATGWTAQIPVGIAVLVGVAYVWANPPARASGSSRSARRERRRATAFFAGLVVVLAALTGPVEGFADELFWVHMVQHLLLMTVAAPLFVLAAPWTTPLRLLGPNARRRAVAWWRGGRSAMPLRATAAFLAAPATAWILFNANLIVWHVPAAFDLTLRNEPVHDLEHLLFLGLGVLFWAQVIGSPPLHRRLGELERLVYVGVAATVGWALSIALTLAPSVLYAPYGQLVSRRGGLSALTDQRIAAGVMLVPGSITFAIVAGVGLTRWLVEEEPRGRSAQIRGPSVAREASSWER